MHAEKQDIARNLYLSIKITPVGIFKPDSGINATKPGA
jgi:hypothetical protein